MRVRVLGCSGGIGGSELMTTAFLVDDDILVDAGTGVGVLSLDQLARIDHVFLTHSHLDHTACLPLLLDTVSDLRDGPVTVYATAETIEILRTHVFNWSVWPDFTAIPSVQRPLLRYRTIEIGQPLRLGGRAFTALPAEHTVPGVGYRLDSGAASLVLTGDTTASDALWEAINGIGNLRYLIIETAFSNWERELAVASKHLCPEMVKDELAKLRRGAEIFITHLKPGQTETTMRELEACVGEYAPRMLQNDQTFDF